MVHGIHSRLLLLPSELKHRIAELSSHDTLASLARTHSSFQREAEQVLYHILSDPSMNCLETLATNSEKAGFVHFLTMGRVNLENVSDGPWRAIDYLLLNVLVNMHSLFDFRMRMPHFEGVPWNGDQEDISWVRIFSHEHQPRIESLEKILCNDHFRLQTLFCDQALDLSRIIRSQTELQILGIYRDEHYEESEFWRILERLQNAQLRLPLVVTLDYRCYPYLNMISISPAFYSIDRLPTIHQVLAEYFDEDQGYEGEINALSIFLVDFCDMPSLSIMIHELSTKNIHMTLRLSSLTFCIEKPCEIPSREMKEIISLFPYLQDLEFILWAGPDGTVSEDINLKMAYVKDWKLACHGLSTVVFTDGSTVQRQGQEKGWILYFS